MPAPKPTRNLSKLVKEIEAFCVEHASAANVAKYSRYFKEGYQAYGVDFEETHAYKKTLLEAHAELGLAGFLDLGDLLFRNPNYEMGSFAIILTAAYRDRIGPKEFQRVGKWLDEGVRNWAHCDVLSGELTGWCLAQGSVKIDELGKWRSSPARFKRRAVPVSLLSLLKTVKNGAPLLEFIRPMMLDEERVVHQGLGWFLREAWKKQPKVVEPFLAEFKDTAARLIFQYATEKMTPEQKARYRRSAVTRKSSRRA
ncbi:MAG: DNA alkylation repair protein [Acidobacteriales bacterium]|nr:DNA alkylation repair protein [Terriglobales bacterium]